MKFICIWYQFLWCCFCIGTHHLCLASASADAVAAVAGAALMKSKKWQWLQCIAWSPIFPVRNVWSWCWSGGGGGQVQVYSQTCTNDRLYIMTTCPYLSPWFSSASSQTFLIPIPKSDRCTAVSDVIIHVQSNLYEGPPPQSGHLATTATLNDNQ